MKEIDQSLIEQANADYEAFQKLGNVTAETVIAFVNKGREVGIRLQSLRAQTKHWEQLTLGNGDSTDGTLRLEFTEQYGKGFIRLAERLTKPATTMVEAVSSMKDVMMLQGVLPFPQTHGDQTLHTKDPFSLITRHVMEIQATWNKELKDRVSQMSDEEKKTKRDQIEPIVKIYELLAA